MVHSKDDAKVEFAKRLKAAADKAGREARGLGAHLAKITNTSPKSPSKWLAGESIPRPDKLSIIAKDLKVSQQWLQFGEGPMQATAIRDDAANAEWLGSLDPWDDETPLGDGEVELPLYKEVELAAGSGTHVVAENNGNKLRFSRRTLKSAGVDPACAACATVTGNSMEPVLLEGTTVGVDTSKTSIKDGDMYAIDHDGMLRIKLLYRMPGNSLKIVSYNKDEWPDELLATDEAQKVRIIGRVFWWSTLR